MNLRFVEDRRTLFWAFVLFPLAPALAYTLPSITPWLVPLSLYLSYCSGVLAHNHSHCPVFESRRANVAYGAWLSFFYGFPLFGWVPTHNQNHHRFVNGPGDITSTTRHSPRNTLLAALTYPLACSSWQLRAIVSNLWHSRRTHPARLQRVALESAVLIFGHAGLSLLAVWLHGPWTGSAVYLATAGLPAALATYLMMFTNYIQHVECTPESADDHSRNFTSPLWNWFVFDNGFHSVHHEHPGVHWSRYRALHAERAARIAPWLNHATPMSYLLDAYFRPSPSRRSSSFATRVTTSSE